LNLTNLFILTGHGEQTTVFLVAVSKFFNSIKLLGKSYRKTVRPQEIQSNKGSRT